MPATRPAPRLRSAAPLRAVIGLTLALCLAVLFVTAPSASAQDGARLWYEVEALNTGLDAPAPDTPQADIDRSTPRQSLRGFLAATKRGDADLAARFLNLSRIEPARQPEAGAEAARKLASIFARQVWIDWSNLPARPDALIERGAQSADRAGQPRRDLHIETLKTGGTEYDIRIARYKLAGGDALWLFTPQTVDNIAPLYDAFGPRPYESRIPDSLKRELAGLWLWEWIALPLLAVLVLGLGWGVRAAMLHVAGRARRNWVEAVFERSSLPLAILTMAGATQALLSWVLSFSGPVQSLLQPTLTIVMVWGVGMTLLRILDAILHRITLRYVGEIDDKRGMDEREFYTSIYALRRLIVLLMVGLAAIIVLARLNLFDSIGMTLLASAGVLTVILGIAGQAVLGNIIASLQIAFAKPVRIGDAVLFEGEWAYVEAIFYTFLRLRTWDKRRIVVPVTYFVSKPFENWSVTEARMMQVIDLWLDPRADVAALRATFEEMLEEDPDVEDLDNAYVYATDQTAEGFKVSFYAMMPDPSTGWVAQSRLREKLMAHVRDHHPEWIARERVQGAESGNEVDPDGLRAAGVN